MFFDTFRMTFQSDDTDPPSFWPLTDEYYGELLDGRGQGNTIEIDPVTQGPVLVPIPEPTWQEWQAPIEAAWRASALAVIARQLEAIEEDEADETPPDLLPGTRKQWLKYRGQVSNWNDTNPDFPDSSKRPVAPT